MPRRIKDLLDNMIVNTRGQKVEASILLSKKLNENKISHECPEEPKTYLDKMIVNARFQKVEVSILFYLKKEI